MNKNKLKSGIAAVMLSAFAIFGLASCDKGTSPGEVNVERSGIVDPEDTDQVGTPSDTDTTNFERHYDHADHENHDDNDAKVIGDGAYDGKGSGITRDEVKN
jgi:hypothetical protein